MKTTLVADSTACYTRLSADPAKRLAFSSVQANGTHIIFDDVAACDVAILRRTLVNDPATQVVVWIHLGDTFVRHYLRRERLVSWLDAVLDPSASPAFTFTTNDPLDDMCCIHVLCTLQTGVVWSVFDDPASRATVSLRPQRLKTCLSNDAMRGSFPRERVVASRQDAQGRVQSETLEADVRVISPDHLRTREPYVYNAFV